MPQVQRIDPIVLPSEKESVAAYCRVSSDSADQLNSYHSQIAYYTKLINDNPDWELYDLYADEGISGTSIKKRSAFKRILVKSVSRFARNVKELLETTRELKDLGVAVVFEKQGFDTSQMMGEMMLTMLALAAQEESQSISKNMRWSYQKRMASGKFICCTPPIGYDLENGLLIKNQESNIVKTIFELYNAGAGMTKIAAYLNQNYSDIKHWGRTGIAKIIRNEKNIGDSLLQKGVTTDNLPFARKENKGEMPQYYVKGTHEGVIPKKVFDNTYRLRESRIHRGSCPPEHMFTHKIVCPDYKRHMRQVINSGKYYWMCAGRAGQATKCEYYRLAEDAIMITATNMAVKLYLYCHELVQKQISVLRELEYRQSGNDYKLFELDQSIADLDDKALTLQKLNNKDFITADEYRVRSEKLTAQRQKLTAQRNKKLHGLQSHSAIEKLEELQAILSSWQGIPTEFDIDQFDEIVEKIIPTADNKLIFRLHCGLELTEDIPS